MVIVVALVVGAVFNISGFNADATNIVLLVFISVDMVIFCLGYLEKIKSDVSKSSTSIDTTTKSANSSLELIKEMQSMLSNTENNSNRILDLLSEKHLVRTTFSNEPISLDFAKNAQHSVFISGGSMRVLQDDHNRGFLKKFAGRKFALTLAFSDYNKEFVIDYVTKYFGKEKSSLSNNKLQLDEAIRKIETSGVKIKTISMDVFNPIAYVAVDYENENKSEFSAIRAKHYLLDEKGVETNAFWLTATPDSPLFAVYQTQIEIIKNQGSKLTTRFSNKEDKAKNGVSKNEPDR